MCSQRTEQKREGGQFGVMVIALALAASSGACGLAEVSVVAITEELGQANAASFVIGVYALGSFAVGLIVGALNVTLPMQRLGELRARARGIGGVSYEPIEAAVRGHARREGPACRWLTGTGIPDNLVTPRSGAGWLACKA